jgi:hypothetical protein
MTNSAGPAALTDPRYDPVGRARVLNVVLNRQDSIIRWYSRNRGVTKVPKGWRSKHTVGDTER